MRFGENIIVLLKLYDSKDEGYQDCYNHIFINNKYVGDMKQRHLRINKAKFEAMRSILKFANNIQEIDPCSDKRRLVIYTSDPEFNFYLRSKHNVFINMDKISETNKAKQYQELAKLLMQLINFKVVIQPIGKNTGITHFKNKMYKEQLKLKQQNKD